MKYTTALALGIRVAIALATCTFFQPDEYFQALEPAHFLVFGYGDLTWEWTSMPPIRSILYPALNVPIYWLLKILILDGISLLGENYCTEAAGTDIWAQELSQKVLGQRYVLATSFLSLTSFFHALSLSRSISNSLETTLPTIALCYYPWGFSVLPSSAITWLVLFARLLWQLRQNPALLRGFITDAISTTCVACCMLFTLDRAYNGTPTLTVPIFLHLNASSISLFYGSASWHYYFTQALPLLAGPALPFALHGHKEWRFLHPLVPTIHLLAARSLALLYDRANSRHSTRNTRSSIKHTHVVLLTLLFIVPSLYVMSHSGEDLSTYQDETDIFFRDPSAFLSTHFLERVDSMVTEKYGEGVMELSGMRGGRVGEGVRIVNVLDPGGVSLVFSELTEGRQRTGHRAAVRLTWERTGISVTCIGLPHAGYYRRHTPTVFSSYRACTLTWPSDHDMGSTRRSLTSGEIQRGYFFLGAYIAIRCGVTRILPLGASVSCPGGTWDPENLAKRVIYGGALIESISPIMFTSPRRCSILDYCLRLRLGVPLGSHVGNVNALRVADYAPSPRRESHSHGSRVETTDANRRGVFDQFIRDKFSTRDLKYYLIGLPRYLDCQVEWMDNLEWVTLHALPPVLEAQLQDVSEFKFLALNPPNPLGKDYAKKGYGDHNKVQRAVIDNSVLPDSGDSTSTSSSQASAYVHLGPCNSGRNKEIEDFVAGISRPFDSRAAQSQYHRGLLKTCLGGELTQLAGCHGCYEYRAVNITHGELLGSEKGAI
ncbi:Alg9-like mannosyltransferase family-domain-containing protein [Russula compacta]|nr:Alg9-like mannosyltransferase family-domain-containing protein [Russula compacta]